MQRSVYLGIMIAALCGCKGKPAIKFNLPEFGTSTYKGLYSFSPEVKSLKECNVNHEYWVIDSSAQLEYQYTQLNLKPDEPVYVEVSGKKIKLPKDSIGSGYDSCIVVKKLIKITKDIPKACN